MNFDHYIQDINSSNTLEDVKNVLINVRREINNILLNRARSKSVFSTLKTLLSRGSRANELNKILYNSNESSNNCCVENVIDEICKLPSIVGSIVPYEFIEAVRQFRNKSKINLEFKDEDIKKEEPIGSGNQGGTTFKCKFKNQQYALQEINHNKVGHIQWNLKF